MKIETYCCPKMETCRIASEEPLQREYRCYNKMLASICVGHSENNDEDREIK